MNHCNCGNNIRGIFSSLNNCSCSCNCNSNNSNNNFTPKISYKTVAEEFVKQYYLIYDSNFSE